MSPTKNLPEATLRAVVGDRRESDVRWLSMTVEALQPAVRPEDTRGGFSPPMLLLSPHEKAPWLLDAEAECR